MESEIPHCCCQNLFLSALLGTCYPPKEASINLLTLTTAGVATVILLFQPPPPGVGGAEKIFQQNQMFATRVATTTTPAPDVRRGRKNISGRTRCPRQVEKKRAFIPPFKNFLFCECWRRLNSGPKWRKPARCWLVGGGNSDDKESSRGDWGKVLFHRAFERLHSVLEKKGGKCLSFVKVPRLKAGTA
ncbi:hypothetical protein CEXT_267231 [Caerostris extrusa]|uniref:Uncharacterized protein n=1 Tax=Caerostris extrusa TaxID=172846 RepID=A0AAV4Y7V1_CAEEX|nr:hypothetical protein CEXT_267231 [Caerostris extrusa]